jgi:hypothetical protein
MFERKWYQAERKSEFLSVRVINIRTRTVADQILIKEKNSCQEKRDLL